MWKLNIRMTVNQSNVHVYACAHDGKVKIEFWSTCDRVEGSSPKQIWGNNN